MITTNKEYRKLLAKHGRYSELVKMVFESCKTHEQFKTASNYASLAKKKCGKTPDQIEEFSRILTLEVQYVYGRGID